MAKDIVTVILMFAIVICTASGQVQGTLRDGIAHVQAPDHFQVILGTNVPNACPIVLNITRSLAPNSTDNFWNMVNYSPPIFENSAFYSVVPGSYVEFGVSGDPNLNKLVGASPLKYDTAILQNTYGTIAFVTNPTQTIGLQIAINLQDNHAFDLLNMAPFGHVRHPYNGPYSTLFRRSITSLPSRGSLAAHAASLRAVLSLRGTRESHPASPRSLGVASGAAKLAFGEIGWRKGGRDRQPDD